MHLVLLTEPNPGMYARAPLRGLPPRLVGVVVLVVVLGVG